MKRLLKVVARLFTVVVTVLYLLSFAASIVSPGTAPLLAVVSIFYLPVAAIFLLLVITWLFVKRTVGIFLLLVFFCGGRNLLATFAVHPLQPEWHWKKAKGSFRIMTWNVNRFGTPYAKDDTANGARKQMLDFISKADVDVLCMQDFRENEQNGVYTGSYVTNVNDVFFTGKFSALHYPFFYEYDAFNYCDKFGVAIYTRLPIIDTGSFVTNEHISPERTAWTDLTFGGKTLRVVNAHLSSMSLWRSEKDSAGLNALRGDSTTQRAKTIFSKLRSSSGCHALEAEKMKAFIRESPYPVLFAADLNSVPSSYVYRQLSAGLQDVFLEKGFGTGGTYNRIYPALRIDVLLHDPRLVADQVTVISTDLSDHNPIIADFHWKQ